MENPIKIDDLGVPVFLETFIYFIMFHDVSRSPFFCGFDGCLIFLDIWYLVL